MTHSINHIKLTRHGFHQSSSYVFATFLFDKNLLLIGENNAGKTSALNSLQLQLLPEESLKSINKKFKFKASSDGKSYTDDETYMYYFPTEESYIISEFQNNSGVFCIILFGSSRTDKKYDRKVVATPYSEIQKLLFDQENNRSTNISRDEFFSAIEDAYVTKTLRNKKSIKETLFTSDNFSKTSSVFNICPLKNNEDMTFNTYSILLKAVYDTQPLVNNEKEFNELISNIVSEKFNSTTPQESFNANQRRSEYDRLKKIKDKIEQLDIFKPKFDFIDNFQIGRPERETLLKLKAQQILSCCHSLQTNSEKQTVFLQDSLDAIVVKKDKNLESTIIEQQNNFSNSSNLGKLTYELNAINNGINFLLKVITDHFSETLSINDLNTPKERERIESLISEREIILASEIKITDEYIMAFNDAKSAEEQIAIRKQNIQRDERTYSNFKIQLTKYTEMISNSELFSSEELNMITSILPLSQLTESFLGGGNSLPEIVTALKSVMKFISLKDDKFYFEGNDNLTYQAVTHRDKRPEYLRQMNAIELNRENTEEQISELEKSLDTNANHSDKIKEHKNNHTRLIELKTALATSKGTLLSLPKLIPEIFTITNEIASTNLEIDSVNALIKELKKEFPEIEKEETKLKSEILTISKNKREYEDILDDFSSPASVFYEYRNLAIDESFSQDSFELSEETKNLRAVASLFHKEHNEAILHLKPFINLRLIDGSDEYTLNNFEDNSNFNTLYGLLKTQMAMLSETKSAIFSEVDSFKHETSLELERIQTMKQQLSSFVNSINERMRGVSISDLKAIQLRIDFNTELLDKFSNAQKKLNRPELDFAEYVNVLDEVMNYQRHKLSHDSSLNYIDLVTEIQFEAKYDLLSDWVKTKQSNGTNSMILIVFISFLLNEQYKNEHFVTFPIIIDEFSKISTKNTLTLFSVINSYHYIVAGATPSPSPELLNCFERVSKVDANIASEYNSHKRNLVVLDDSVENSFENTHIKTHVVKVDLREGDDEQRYTTD